jgi:sugar lactone lactonase YvrE
MTVQTDVEVVTPPRDHLGEGPHWDSFTQTLVRVDATAGRVMRLDPATGTQECLTVGSSVGFAIPRAAGGFVLGVEREIVVIEDDGSRRVVGNVGTRDPTVRFNDGKCDGAGRLWAGTMSSRDIRGTGSLYRLCAPRRIERAVANVTVSNGPAWNLAGDRMYFADSPSGRIDVFDYEPDTAAISGRRPFVQFGAGEGFPDGMAVDAEDCLWVCAFEGGEVRRHAPDGGLVQRIAMPVSNPTSLAFGGPTLNVLYVTSAKHRLSDDQLEAQPLAGAVFALDPKTSGTPAVRSAI